MDSMLIQTIDLDMNVYLQTSHPRKYPRKGCVLISGQRSDWIRHGHQPRLTPKPGNAFDVDIGGMAKTVSWNSIIRLPDCGLVLVVPDPDGEISAHQCMAVGFRPVRYLCSVAINSGHGMLEHPTFGLTDKPPQPGWRIGADWLNPIGSVSQAYRVVCNGFDVYSDDMLHVSERVWRKYGFRPMDMSGKRGVPRKLFSLKRR